MRNVIDLRLAEVREAPRLKRTQGVSSFRLTHVLTTLFPVMARMSRSCGAWREVRMLQIDEQCSRRYFKPNIIIQMRLSHHQTQHSCSKVLFKHHHIMVGDVYTLLDIPSHLKVSHQPSAISRCILALHPLFLPVYAIIP